MKNYNKIIFRTLIFLLIGVFSFIAFDVYAADYYNILGNRHGTIEKDGYEIFPFEVPVDSTVTIKILGEASNYAYTTYGDYSLEILDVNDQVLYTSSGYTYYDNKDVYGDLTAGSYKLKVIADYSSLSYSFYMIGVPLEYYPAATISLSRTSLTLVQSKAYTLRATLDPRYSTGNITWTSSKTAVATVNSAGKVTAKNLGYTNIIARKDGKSAICRVTVNKTSKKTIVKKRTSSFVKYVKNIPGYKSAKWTTSKKSVATVSTKGKVTAKKVGSATITAKIKGKKYYIPIKVVPLVSAVSAGVDEAAIYNDAYVKITNNSSKSITYMKLQIYQYDNKGSKLTSPYDYFYINDTIGGKKTVTYKFWVNDDTKRIKVKILKVWFKGGTTWRP